MWHWVNFATNSRLFGFQILSRLKPAGKKKKEEEEKRKKQLPKLEEFLANRDYTGAITLLEVSTYIAVPWFLRFGLC